MEAGSVIAAGVIAIPMLTGIVGAIIFRLSRLAIDKCLIWGFIAAVIICFVVTGLLFLVSNSPL